MTPPRGVHVVHKRLASGAIAEYHYAYRGGPRLPEPHGSPAYYAAYAAAVEERAAPIKSAPTLARLIADYQRSPKFERLAESTQRLYRGYLTQIGDVFGAAPLAAFASPRMRAEIGRWHMRPGVGDRAADAGLETLQSLLTWGMAEARVSANPAAGHAARHFSDRSGVIWEPDELAALLDACANDETRNALTLAAYTGLRRGDLIGLRWDEVALADGVIERRTLKSRRRQRAVIPLLPEARAAIEASPRRALTVLTSTARRPWAPRGLSAAFEDARSRCGVAKRLHDLRGTACTMFAAAGLTNPEIARIMGWSEAEADSIIQRYVSRRHVAAAIVRRLRPGD